MVQAAETLNNTSSHKAKGIAALQAGNLSRKMIAGFLLAICLFVASAILVVWTRNQVVALGYQINDAKDSLDDLREKNRRLIADQYEIVNLENLQNVSDRLGLEKPTRDQILVIVNDESKEADR